MEISLFFQRLSWRDFLSIIRPNKKVRPCEQPHLQGRESKGAPLLLGRYVAHVAALGLALLFLQGHALLVHHPLEEAGLLLFGGGEHGHGQAADEGRLADGNQVLRGPVQGQGGSEVITEQEEHQGHQVHDDALGAFARLRGHPHLDNHGHGHDEGQDVDRDAEQVAYGVGQGQVRHPQAEGLAPQLRGILEHAVEGEEDLLNALNADSELNVNNGGNDKLQAIIEHAANGDESFDDIMNEWNQKWTDAQESEGVEITE